MRFSVDGSTKNEDGINQYILILTPETKQEKHEYQLIRWRLKNNFQDVIVPISRVCAGSEPERRKGEAPSRYRIEDEIETRFIVHERPKKRE